MPCWVARSVRRLQKQPEQRPQGRHIEHHAKDEQRAQDQPQPAQTHRRGPFAVPLGLDPPASRSAAIASRLRFARKSVTTPRCKL